MKRGCEDRKLADNQTLWHRLVHAEINPSVPLPRKSFLFGQKPGFKLFHTSLQVFKSVNGSLCHRN